MWVDNGHFLIKTRRIGVVSLGVLGVSTNGLFPYNKAYTSPFNERRQSAKQHPNLSSRPRE